MPRRMGRGTRPEFDHDVLVIAVYRQLGLHCSRSAKVWSCLAWSPCFQHKMLVRVDADHSPRGHMELNFTGGIDVA